MKDKQLFIEKFNDILQETGSKYNPFPDDIKAVTDFFDMVIIEWDGTLKVYGSNLLDHYKEIAKQSSNLLIQIKTNLDPGPSSWNEGPPPTPINTPISIQKSKAFLLESMLRAENFIIDYLEGLEKDKPTQALTLEDIIKKDNLFIRGMDMKIVVDYFIKLKQPRKNKPPYLSNDQFILFLRKGFLQEDGIDKIKLNTFRGDKVLILKLFHWFCVSIVGKDYTPNRPDDHINWFVQCFNNWTFEEVKQDFKQSRTNKNI